MTKTLNSMIAAILFSLSVNAVAAPVMSCMVDTPAYDEFNERFCFGLVYGARYTTAVFRVDNPPSKFQIIWDKICQPSTSNTSCAVTIRAFRPYTMAATVLDFDSYKFYRVQATAEFEDGR